MRSGLKLKLTPYLSLCTRSARRFIALFPAWGEGEAASFITLRARGGFLVSAGIDVRRRVVPGVTIASEVGSRCRVYPPWEGRAPVVTDTTASPSAVPVESETVRGVHVYGWATIAGHTYSLA